MTIKIKNLGSVGLLFPRLLPHKIVFADPQVR